MSTITLDEVSIPAEYLPQSAQMNQIASVVTPEPSAKLLSGEEEGPLYMITVDVSADWVEGERQTYEEPGSPGYYEVSHIEALEVDGVDAEIPITPLLKQWIEQGDEIYHLVTNKINEWE